MTPGKNDTLAFDNPNEKMYLTGYIVARIAYELIKNYMISNTPAACGVTLSQSYTANPAESSIFLDMGYNFQASKSGKVPAVYVQRGEMDLKNQTIGTISGIEKYSGGERRRIFTTMPIIVTCVAAEPLAVVENLAEYVKQPLLYFRKEVEQDFCIRRFMVDKISAPQLDGSGKNNFKVDIMLTTVFDEGWIITRESMKMRRLGVEFYDSLRAPIQSFIV